MFVSGAIKISTLKSLHKVRRAVVRINCSITTKDHDMMLDHNARVVTWIYVIA